MLKIHNVTEIRWFICISQKVMKKILKALQSPLKTKKHGF